MNIFELYSNSLISLGITTEEAIEALTKSIQALSLCGNNASLLETKEELDLIPINENQIIVSQEDEIDVFNRIIP